MEKLARKVICALDTAEVAEAVAITKRLAPVLSSFKVGLPLYAAEGMAIVERLREAGAKRVFLDLKLHDYPDSAGLVVCEAARRGVWMLSLHIAGGPAMIEAAVEEANQCSPEVRPLLIGVPLLNCIDQHTLSSHFAVARSFEEQSVYLARLGMDYDLDGIGCAPQAVPAVRQAIRHGIIVSRGVRQASPSAGGADYVLLGRALTSSSDPIDALKGYGLAPASDESVLA